MLERLENPVALEELATLVGLSRYHFCTAFGLAMGRTPHAWLTEQRMTRARRLLSNPDMSISEIAVAVGYATPSAFSAGFRRIVGMTPSAFRRAL
jgi:AraC family transcriptional regulator